MAHGGPLSVICYFLDSFKIIKPKKLIQRHPGRDKTNE
jgi:hypothetical protein